MRKTNHQPTTFDDDNDDEDITFGLLLIPYAYMR